MSECVSEQVSELRVTGDSGGAVCCADGGGGAAVRRSYQDGRGDTLSAPVTSDIPSRREFKESRLPVHSSR